MTVRWGSLPGPLGSGPPLSFGPPAAGTAVLVGAGDIAECRASGDEATASLLDQVDGLVFTTGDNVYPSGSLERFERCYAPSWGRHLDRTRFPVAGNHDWDIAGAAGYRAYFGAAAVRDGVTWYAETVGAWRVIVLDSECREVGGCEDGSPQHAWLKAELAANPARCTLALWHVPRFSSGRHGDDRRVEPFWRLLHDAGAELIVNGHDHDYERFAPQDPDGAHDPDVGIREIVVGTGGSDLRSFGRAKPNSEVRIAGVFGVLRLELAADGYGWAFLPAGGAAATDEGTGTCR